MAAEVANLVLRAVMELAATGALAAGVWEAVRGARAKLRAREIAETQFQPTGNGAIDRDIIDKLLEQLSDADRSKVVEALEQRNPAAAKRYLHDIFPEAVAHSK